MQAMKCEICGSNDIVKQEGVYVCQHCGTKYTVEEAQKLVGVVKIDKSEENEKYLILARRALKEENAANAIKYYNLVAENDPSNWEPVLYVPYFQFINNATHDTSYAFNNAIKSACQMIEKQVPVDKRNEIAESIYHITYRAGPHARVNGTVYQFMSTAMGELRNLFNRPDLADKLEKEYRHYQEHDDTVHQIQMRQLERMAPAKRGCYIATCVYGSYDCPEVWVLRRYRDNSLAATWHGRAFIRTYYAISPKLVTLFGNTSWFKCIWRSKLDHLVDLLRKEGVSDTPYTDI